MNQSNGLIKIETGIPKPPTMGRGAKKYPFATMEIDQSFFIARNVGTIATIRSAANQYQRRHKGMRFMVYDKQTDKNGVIGTRVWRIQ